MMAFHRSQYESLDQHTWTMPQVLAAVAAISMSVGVMAGLMGSTPSTNLVVGTTTRPALQTAAPIAPFSSTTSARTSAEVQPYGQSIDASQASGAIAMQTSKGPSMAAFLVLPALAAAMAAMWNLFKRTAAPVDPMDLISTAPPTPASTGCIVGGHRIDYAMFATSGKKVAVLGAAGGIGQPLSLLLKGCDMVSHLSIYDLAPFTLGVGVDLAHINTPTKVTGHKGDEELEECLKGSDVVVIPAGVARKPGMTRDDLFNTNASIIASLVGACAKACPQAILVIIANPVNSLVPIAAEVMKKAGVHDPRKVIGVTSLDITRANTWVAEINGGDPRDQDVVVIGGHAGTTILPLLSQVPGSDKWTEEQFAALTKRIQFGGEEVVQAKDGAGSATLSMAYAGAEFVRQILKALNGAQGIVECCYTENDVTDASFFSVPTTLGPNGAEAVHKFGAISDFEQEGLDAMLPDLKAQIAKGLAFAEDL